MPGDPTGFFKVKILKMAIKNSNGAIKNKIEV
jgi:hypothetical protein